MIKGWLVQSEAIAFALEISQELKAKSSEFLHTCEDAEVAGEAKFQH